MTHSCSSSTQSHRALIIALWIAFFFMFVEVIGGWLANSLALITDALHMFTDVGAIALSLLALRIARFPATNTMSYGFHRAEILGALASALSLWALCGVIIYEAIMRLITPSEVKGPLVFIIATIGLGANLVMMKKLHPVQESSINVRAAYLHVLGDLLGSIGIIIAGGLIWITHWNPLDPLITLIFSIFILFSSWKIIKESVVILMESAPEGVNLETLQADLLSITGVKDVHDLHVWAVSVNRLALSVHLIAEDTKLALDEAHQLIEKNHHIHHMTIQVEAPGSFQSRFCYDEHSS